MLLDAALIGAILAVQSVTPVPHALRVVVFANVTAIAYQFLIFLRTDVYALFLVATGCRNLWGVKGALARRAVGRASDADRALLAATAPREIASSRSRCRHSCGWSGERCTPSPITARPARTAWPVWSRCW
jgi:hypothetical protein